MFLPANTRAEKRKDILFRVAVLVPAGIVVALLFLIMAQVVVNGGKALNLDSFSSSRNPLAKWAGASYRQSPVRSWCWPSRLS
jgi:hypothetical protein